MPRNYSESVEQKGLFARLKKIPYRGARLADFCFAIPNAGTTGGRRGLLAGARRKAEGVMPGVPDIMCFARSPIYPSRGLFVEMKRADGKPSDVKKQQRDVMEMLENNGYMAEVAFGAEQAFQIITGYLGL